MAIVWCDGSFLAEEEFTVSPFDRSLCHGLSLFETILAVEGRPRLLDAHLDRLRLGLDRFGITGVTISNGGLENAIVSLLDRNELGSGMARVRLAVGFGVGPMNTIDTGEAWAWMTAVQSSLTEDSIRITPAPWKQNKGSATRGLKVGNYAEHIIAMDLSRREGFDEMLFYNTSDELCEAAMANIFLIRGNGLQTPSLDSGCLDGITRKEIFEIAKNLDVTCVEKPLVANDVKKADGIFLTSSIRGPVGVSEYKGRKYDNLPVFQAIRETWLRGLGKTGLNENSLFFSFPAGGASPTIGPNPTQRNRIPCHDQSPYSQASGPISRLKNSLLSPQRWVMTVSNSLAGVTISMSTRRFQRNPTLRRNGSCSSEHGLTCYAISNHLVGQAICDNIDDRHKSILSPEVWGDGDPEGVRKRAAKQMIRTGKAARKFFDAKAGAEEQGRVSGGGQRIHRIIHLACALCVSAYRPSILRQRLRGFREAFHSDSRCVR